jgi:hypothetical protein
MKRVITAPPKPWSFEDRKTLAKYAGKIHLPQLAAMMGRTVPSLKCRARKDGLSLIIYGERNATAKFPDSTVEHARRLHESGFGPESISRQMGIGIHTVRSWIYFHNRRNDQLQFR